MSQHAAAHECEPRYIPAMITMHHMLMLHPMPLLLGWQAEFCLIRIGVA
jgi:hypothetical protein